MNTNRNPYSPPRAQVADIAVARATSATQMPSGPLAWLGLADLMLLLLIARYALVLRSRGALR